MMNEPGTSQSAPDADAISAACNGNMKDYATQISELKKENFSLKLRIFYMEERMQEGFTGDYEHVLKSNIELKVECDSLRKELKDKHDLLIKASNAVACMEAVPNEVQKAQEDAQRELQQVRDAMQDKVQEADRELRDVRAEADDLAKNVNKLQDYVKKLEGENEELETYCKKANEEIAALKESQIEEEYTPEVSEASVMQQEILEKDRLIAQLRETLNMKQIMIEVLESEKKLEQEQLESCRGMISSLEKKNENTWSEMVKVKQEDELMRGEYMQHISDQQQKLDEFEIATGQMSEELEKREEEVQDLTKALKDAEETTKELACNLEELQDEHEAQKSNELIMRDKAISGLTEVVRKKEEEVASLKSDITSKESSLEELTETIKSMSLHNDSLDKKILQMEELQQEVQQLQCDIRDLELENQRLSSEVKSSEERIQSMDEIIKNKDEKLQQLLVNYEKLEEQQKQATPRASRDQSEMEPQFEQEKIEFTELMKKSETFIEDSEKDADAAGTEAEVKYLREQLYVMEKRLQAKQKEIEEATIFFKRAKNESRSTLDELEAAMNRRDEEQKKEVESSKRINDAKTAEIQRLHNEILLKEGRIQNLEDDLLILDRKVHEAKEKEILHERQSCRWKEDSDQKDYVIARLTKSLEDLSKNTPSHKQKQFVKLAGSEKDDDASRINSLLESLRLDNQEYKKELDNARNLINSLTSELESSQQRTIALEQSCEMKDQVIEDLKASHKHFPMLSTEENSCRTTEDKGSNTDGSQRPSPALSEERVKHSNGEKEQAGVEDFNGLKDEYDDTMTSYESVQKNAKQRKHLTRLTEILNEEQNIYRKQHHTETSEDAVPSSDTRQVFDAQLQHIKRLRENLCTLLLEVTDGHDVAVQSNIDEHQESVDAQLLELQDELTKTRCKLANTVEELADETRQSSVDRDKLEAALRQTNIKNTELQRCLEEAHHKVEMKDGEITALRAEVDKLRILGKRSKGSDTDVLSICSDDESEDLSSLSRRELMDVINNTRKKLENAEKLNELLRQQLEQLKSNLPSGADVDRNLTERLTVEVEHLREQLRNTQISREIHNGHSTLKSPTKITPQVLARSKLPIPVDKSHEPRESTPREKVEVVQLRERCRHLRDKLSATEETVRHQKQKLEKCKSAMAVAGIGNVMLSPIRSARSHPNLLFEADAATDLPSRDTVDLGPRQRHPSTETVEAHTQTLSDDTGYSSLSSKSEEKFNSLIQAQAKELSALRQQLSKSRGTCKDLRVRLNVVLQYISTLLNSEEGPAGTMFASSITTELDRCKELTRKLKRHLSEWSNESSTSDTESEGSHDKEMSSIIHGQSSQIMMKNEELQKKNKKILELEQRLYNLMQQKRDIDTQTPQSKPKGLKFQPENIGILTPSSSRHSIDSDTEDDLSTTLMFPTVSQNTEYVPLPDRQSPRRERPSEVQSRGRRRGLPMYQRTIAVTEYLPDATDDYIDSGFSPARHRLSTVSDAGVCTATYGGSWSSPAVRSDRNFGNGFNPVSSHIDRFSEHLISVGPESPEVDVLRRQLAESRCLNESLRQELDLANEILREVKESEGYGSTKGNPIDVLDSHLKGIQALRQHLESSIQMNDGLRKRLEQQSNGGKPEDFSANVYLLEEPRDDCESDEVLRGLCNGLSIDANSRLEHQRRAEAHMKQNYAAAARELEQLRMKLAESSCQTDMLGKHIDILNSEVDEERLQNEMLQSQLRDRDEELDELREKCEEYRQRNDQLVRDNQEIKESACRVRDEINRVNEELDESHHLVRSLKSELALYEKVRKKGALGESKSKTPGFPLDISEFLVEIKRLRVQLERSIEVNGALRKQLQEQLHYNKSNSTPCKTTTINISNLPPSPHAGQTSERRRSVPRSKEKLKMNGDHKSTSVLITPPPSALSCSEESGPSFEFSTSSTKKVFNHTHGEGSPNWPYYSSCGPYIVGNLDDYDALKRKITDGRLLIRGVEANVCERLAGSPVVPTRAPWKQVQENLKTLVAMLEESGCLLKMFWPADIPPPPFGSGSLGEDSCVAKAAKKRSGASDVSKCSKDAGFASDSSVNLEADGLRREVRKLHKRLSAQDRLLQSTVSRLQTANRMKEGIEHAILKQLTVTHDVLKKARGNLEAQAAETRSTDSSAAYS